MVLNCWGSASLLEGQDALFWPRCGKAGGIVEAGGVAVAFVDTDNFGLAVRAAAKLASAALQPRCQFDVRRVPSHPNHSPPSL